MIGWVWPGDLPVHTDIRAWAGLSFLSATGWFFLRRDLVALDFRFLPAVSGFLADRDLIGVSSSSIPKDAAKLAF